MGTFAEPEWAGPASQVSFGVTNLSPPSRVYITQDDLIQIIAVSNLPNLSPAFSFRIMTPDGKVTRSSLTVMPSNLRASSVATFNLTEGFLLSLGVNPNAGGVPRGSLYCIAKIVYGAVGGSVQELLFAGYVQTNSITGWPESIPENYISGVGNFRTIVGTVPAAGADISETVPAGATWRLHAFQTSLVTAVAVATRTPRLTIDDGTNQYFRAESALQQAASLTKFHQWGENLVNAAGLVDTATMPLPGPLYLPGGSRIRTLTSNIQPADQWAAPIYTVEEWIGQ